MSAVPGGGVKAAICEDLLLLSAKISIQYQNTTPDEGFPSGVSFISGVRNSVNSAEIGGIEFFNRLFEFFTGAEFDHGTFRDDDFITGVAGIAAFAALADFDFKNTEVAQFDITAFDKFLGDIVQSHLDDGGNVALNNSGFFGNFDNKVTFSHFLKNPSVW
jgi:hypothetical protein